MTQDERWTAHWQEIIDFMEANHRRPSKHREEERHMHNWWKQQKKLLNAGALSADRKERFGEMLSLGAQYHHVNQFQ